MCIRSVPVLHSLLFSLVFGSLLFALCPARSQTLGPDFVGAYSLRDLGAPAGVPTSLGGMTFKAGDPDTFLIGGEANGSSARIYSIRVARGVGGHITGFAGTASVFAEAGGLESGGIDGGLDYGPGGVLFYTTYNDNVVGQLKPGSTVPDKKISLDGLGIVSSVGALNFVPAGLPGSGRLKITSYSGYNWYDTTVTPDGSGTYNILAPTKSVDFDNKPEGFAYVKAGSPRFPNHSVLIGFYTSDMVRAFEVDANGDPIIATARDFVIGLNGITGAARDPLTGDFLFASFSDPHVYIVGGFSTTPAQVNITSPTEGQIFTQPVAFDLEATAIQTGGSIDRVEFFYNQGLFDTARHVPYRTSISGWANGAYAFYAVAYDGSGMAYTSAVVHVTIQNSPIQVQMATPTNGTILPSCSGVWLAAQVSGGALITNVSFFAGSSKLGQVNGASVRFRVPHLGEGYYSIYAVAKDNAGSFGTSAPRQITVLPLATNDLVGTLLNPSQFLLCFKGPAGSNCVWETKDSLSKPWHSFATNQSASGLWQFTNAFPGTVPAAFYRAHITR